MIKGAQKKVLIVSTSLSQNRIIRSSLIEYLSEQGFKVFHCGDGKSLSEAELVWPFAMSTSPSFVKDVSLFFSLSKLILKIRPHLIISYSPRGNLYAGFIARLVGINYVTIISGFGRYRSALCNELSILGRLFLYAIGQSKQIIAMNDSDYKLLKSSSRQQIFKINSEGFNVPEEKISKNTKCYKSKKFLFFSRINTQKGIFTALKTFEGIRAIYPDALLSVAGEIDSGMGEDDRVLLDKLLQSPGVIFYGRVTEEVKSLLYQESTYYLFPSTYGEGLPMTLLESQYYYCVPVVMPETPGSMEAIHPDFRNYSLSSTSFLKSTLSAVSYFANSSNDTFPDVRGWIYLNHSQDVILEQYKKILY